MQFGGRLVRVNQSRRRAPEYPFQNVPRSMAPTDANTARPEHDRYDAHSLQYCVLKIDKEEAG